MNDPLEEHPTPILLVVIRCSEISASHSSITGDSNLPGCYAMLTAEYLPTFRRIELPSLPVINIKKLYPSKYRKLLSRRHGVTNQKI
jgi:hypothetical protein